MPKDYEYMRVRVQKEIKEEIVELAGNSKRTLSSEALWLLEKGLDAFKKEQGVKS